MNLAQGLLDEVKYEAMSTRKLLERVPFDKADYKPHPKSMSLKQLATHVAEISGWYKETLLQDVLDFAAGDYVPKEINNTADLLALHDKNIAQAEKILSEVSQEEFGKMWTMKNGDTVYFTMPKAAVVRSWCMNHLYHHRAQLTVYLRMLDVALPSIYGPTADEGNM